MAYTVITGVKNIGNIPRKINPAFLEVFEELTFGNNPDMTKEPEITRIAEAMTETTEGIEGKRIETTYSSLFFTDDGLATSSPAFGEYKKYFTLKRKAYQIKDFEYSIDMMEKALENKIDLMGEIRDKTRKCVDLYRKKYIPAINIQTLITGDSSRTVVPADGTGQGYEYQFGALRGETVENVAPWATTQVRNHFWAVGASTGLSFDDLSKVKAYMSDYEDSSGSWVVFGKGDAFDKFINVFNDTMTKDKIIAGGVNAIEVNDFSFVRMKEMPSDFLLIVDSEMAGIILKMVSPEATLTGLMMVHEQGYPALDAPEQIAGTLVKIGKEGRHLIKRHKVLWLDIDKSRYNAGNAMQAGGFTALNNHVTKMLNGWYKSVK